MELTTVQSQLDALTPQMQSLNTEQDAKKSRSQALRGMWKTAFKMAKAKSREPVADGAAPDGGGDGDGGGGGGGGSSGGGVGSGGDGRDIERGGTPNRDSATPDPEGKKGPKLYLITQKLLKKRASKIEEGAKDEEEVDPVYALLQSASETRDKARSKRSGGGSFDESEEGSLSGRRSAASEEAAEASRDSTGATPGATPQHPQQDATGNNPAIADSSFASFVDPSQQPPQPPQRRRRGSPSSPVLDGSSSSASVPIPSLSPNSPSDQDDGLLGSSAPRDRFAPEPSTCMSDESPTSTPEKKHKSFGFRFGKGKKKKSTSDLAETLEGAVGGGSKTSLVEEATAEEDPLFAMLNEGRAKRNLARKLSKQKTSDCEDD